MEALAQTAATAAVLLSASRVWIALRDRHGVIVPRIAYMLTPEGAPREIAPDSIPLVIADTIRNLANTANAANGESAPLALGDMHKTPALVSQLGPDSAVMRALGSALLTDNGVVIGAIIVTSAKPDGLADYRRVMLNTFAKLAVDTIQMFASAENNKAQAEELSAILSASQALTSTLDPDELFRTIIENIQRVVVFDSALIYRYEKRARRLRVIAATGEEAERLTGSTIAEDAEGSRVARAVRERKLNTGAVGPADSVGEHTEALRGGGSARLLCMPLITRGRLRGVATLARASAFSAAETSALERLSPIIATALENVGLYQQSQAERQQLEALFASASDGIALVNEDLLFIQVNAAFARYLATDEESLLGKSVCKALSRATDGSRVPGSCPLCDDGPDCLLRMVMRTRAQRDHVECVFPPAPPDHTSGGADSERPSEGPATTARTIDFSLTPMLGPGQRQRLLLVGRDVSGARAIERFRAEQMHLIGHDMGSPLNAITRNIELFIKLYGAQVPREHLPMLTASLSSAYSISYLLADLELVTRKDAGQLTFDLRPMNLVEEVNAAALELRMEARGAGVALSFEPDPQVPHALADPIRVRQVARNLIGNAIKYTPRGGDARVRVFADGAWVTLAVEDTGVGVPAAAKPYIWQRYFQADRDAPGSGLGLASVRIIAKAHHGHVNLRENPAGRGSIFSVSFPRAGHRA